MKSLRYDNLYIASVANCSALSIHHSPKRVASEFTWHRNSQNTLNLVCFLKASSGYVYVRLEHSIYN